MEDGIARSPGHCMTMGTASTMTAIAETLGMTLPGASSIPAVHSDHSRMAAPWTADRGDGLGGLKTERHSDADSFDNAITADMAIGGSTNAIMHLMALAGRTASSSTSTGSTKSRNATPMIANLRPSGQFLMEDFYYAGGLQGLLKQISPLLKLDCLTASGKTLGENLACPGFKTQGHSNIGSPVAASGGTAVLYGNLAPDGAVIKPTRGRTALSAHGTGNRFQGL